MAANTVPLRPLVNGSAELRPGLAADDLLEALKANIMGALIARPAAHTLHPGLFGDTAHLSSTGG